MNAQQSPARVPRGSAHTFRATKCGLYNSPATEATHVSAHSGQTAWGPSPEGTRRQQKKPNPSHPPTQRASQTEKLFAKDDSEQAKPRRGVPSQGGVLLGTGGRGDGRRGPWARGRGGGTGGWHHCAVCAVRAAVGVTRHSVKVETAKITAKSSGEKYKE